MSPHAEHFRHKIETIKKFVECSKSLFFAFAFVFQNKYKLKAASYTIWKDSFTKLLRVTVNFGLWFSVEGKFTTVEKIYIISLESNGGGQRWKMSLGCFDKEFYAKG